MLFNLSVKYTTSSSLNLYKNFIIEENIAKSTILLYGGSVKADNARQLLVMPDIDGVLVGGASLKAASFLAICQAAAELA